MDKRIWVEYVDLHGRIGIELGDETGLTHVISQPQAEQLILDLQALVDGQAPDDDPSVLGIE